MKAITKVAKRYAKAIFAGCAPDSLEHTNQVLTSFVKALNESADLQQAMGNPALQTDLKMQIIEEILKPVIGSDRTALNSILLLIENRRFSEIEGVVTTFTAMVENWKKMRSVKITSAFELSADERQNMVAQIQKDLGGAATVTWEVDPAIIGGLQVKAADLLLDGSIRTSLERMRASLLQ